MFKALRTLESHRLLAWLPNSCAVCRSGSRGSAGRVCEACRDRFAPDTPRCEACALRVPAGVRMCGACLKQPPPWSAAVAACDYGHPWDGLLQSLKFHEALDLAPALARMLTLAVQHHPLAAADVLLPVPLSTERLRERGHNQASVIAAALAHPLGLPLQRRWLLRLIDTPHQLALPRAQRVANVRGAFAVEPLALQRLRGQRVALVDDVMTTGATLAEATRVLLQAGAASVQVWVIARTPR